MTPSNTPAATMTTLPIRQPEQPPDPLAAVLTELRAIRQLLTAGAGDRSQDPGPHQARPELLTLKDLAELLRVAISSLHRQRAAGKIIPATCHVARSPRWDRQTVEDWIAAGMPLPKEWQARQRAGR